MTRLVLNGANLLDGVRPARPDSVVIVSGNRIESVGEAASYIPSPDDRMIDCAERTVMPGLWVCHFHAEYDEPLASRYDEVFTGAERPHGVQLAYAIRTARRALLSGVTGVIGAGCSHDVDVELNMSIEAGIVEGPRMLPAGTHINTLGGESPQGAWWYEMGNTGLEGVFCSGPEEFRREVRRQVSRGAGIVKLIASGGHGYRQSAEVATCDEDELRAAVTAAHRRGKLARAHVAYREEILMCVRAGIDIVDHADSIDQACIDEMAEHGTIWAPTVYSARRHKEIERRLVDPACRHEYAFDNIAEHLPLAAAAGITIICGDDWGVPGMRHGYGVYAQELAVMVEELGVKPLDALRYATVNGARTYGAGSELGVIEAGRLADVLVLDGDPVEDITILTDPQRYLRAVMKDGVLYKDELGAPVPVS
jgi:imidazolonepropionase-like amidohydrolase